MPAKTAKSIELQGVDAVHTSIKQIKKDKNEKGDRKQNKHGPPTRRDTIDSIVVNMALNQNEGDINSSAKTVMWIRRIILILICTAVAGGFLVPVVIYYTEADQGMSNATVAMLNLDIDNCQPSTNDSVWVSRTYNNTLCTSILDNVHTLAVQLAT